MVGSTQTRGSPGRALSLGFQRRAMRLFLLPGGEPRPRLSITIAVMKQLSTDAPPMNPESFHQLSCDVINFGRSHSEGNLSSP